MILRKSITHFGGMLATGILLAACNSQETPSDSPVSSNLSAEGPLTQETYAEAVLKLKHTIRNPELLNQKVLELKNKYSVLDGENSFNTEFPAGPTRLEEAPTNTAPLQKTAATNGLLVKDYQLPIRQTFRGQFSVGPVNSPITITAQAIGTADPFVVLYTHLRSNGAIPNGTEGVIAYDDDGAGGLSSRVNYITPSSPALDPYYFIVFSANGLAGVGNVNITVNIHGQITTYNNVPARGAGTVTNNVVASPCNYSLHPISNFALTNPTTNAACYFFSMDGDNQATIRSASSEVQIGYNGSTLSQWTPDYSFNLKPNFALPFTNPGSAEGIGNFKQHDSCN